MKKTVTTAAVVLALALSGCTATPESTDGQTVSEIAETTSGVATDAITKALAKNTVEMAEEIAGVAETLIENAEK